MKSIAVSAAALAAYALLSAGPAAAAGPMVLSDAHLDTVSAGSAFSVAQAIANALGRRGTLTITTTDTQSTERAARRYTRSLSDSLAIGDRASSEVSNQSGVAGNGTAVSVTGQVGTSATRGTSQSQGRTTARGGPLVSVAHGTSVSVGVGAQTDAAAAAGSGAAGNFLTISNQVVVPVSAGRASVAVAVPWAIAVSLPDSVNALLGR